MKKGREYMIVFYTLAALVINLAGRNLSDVFKLPVWLDSMGTFLIAYTAGPVCGALVGFTNNIVYGIFVEKQSIYCIVGALLGIVVGWLAKKKVFESQFKTVTMGMGLAIFSTFVSVIINIALYDGLTGNVWGDQIMLLLMNYGFPKYVAYIDGQFCVEFLDKLLSVELVYLVIRGFRHLNKHCVRRAALFISALAGLCALTTDGSVYASDDYDSYVQIQYSNQEGLLSGEANDIEQTKDGKLWIGTYAGLFKYDGSKFTLFKDIPSIRNVNCLYVDEEGRLWVGTNDNGLTIMINEHVMNTIDDENGLLSNSVKDIVCDSKGNYYIGTVNGVAEVSLSGGVRVTKSFEEIKNVTHMTADDKGNVIITTERGMIYWLYDGELCSIPFDYPLNGDIRAAYFTPDDRLILGAADSHIYIFDMTSKKPRLLEDMGVDLLEGINSFYSMENGEIFLCSDSGVAIIGNDYSVKKLNTNSFISSIDNMLVDYLGNLWFSSSRLGLLELCVSPFDEMFAEISEKKVVNSTELFDGLLYCGTDDGLVIIDEKNDERVYNEISELLERVRIRCIKTDSKGKLWIATTGEGVYEIEKHGNGSFSYYQYTQSSGLPGMRFRSVCELSDGKMAVAGDLGVALIDNGRVCASYTLENGLRNEKSLCLLEYKGVLYVGSDGGGITRIVNGTVGDNIGKKDGLSSEIILRMVREPVHSGMFIVTSNGLCYMSNEGEIKALKNFPYSNNYDILCEENGSCRILSSAGIYMADCESLIADEKRDYPLINSKRGFRSTLTANSWTCESDSAIYLCCGSGVVKAALTGNGLFQKSYRMVLNSVTVDGEKYSINRADTFKMTSDMNKIVFEPEVLNYSMNDPYVSVLLEGYDEKPSVCLLSELGSFAYSGLKPGRYVFRISILDGIDGNILESGGYLIEKETEMYQHWWFKLYAVVIVCLVLMWITWFITRIQSQKTLLKQKYELEYAKKQIKMGNETILSIARAVDAKDTNTSEHSYRVSEYSVAIAKRLRYSPEKCENLRQMALLHDIGKIGIPDAILNKPSRLTDEEYEIMKTHVIKGGEILKDFTIIDNVNVGALYHHERYDGKGYCHGLKGEEIPLDARIIGIADAFDAMTANRVYRKQLDIGTVIAELKRCSGTQFDPRLVDIMLSLIADGVIDVESLYRKSKEDRQS